MNRSDLNTPRSLRWKLPVVGGVLAGTVLLGGGVALADGLSSSSSDSGTTSGDAATPPAPGDAPTPPAGGNAPTPPAGGNSPTPPAGGNGPTPSGQGDGPTPPHTGGNAPTPPAGGPGGHGPAGAEAGDRVVGTVAEVSDSALTITDDTGATHEFTLSEDTRVDSGPGSAPDSDTTLTAGDRVEVRGTDGAAAQVHEVLAHVDGVVTGVDGDILTVVTTPGLHVRVDADALDQVPAVGDDVHLQGTVADDGETVVATGSVAGPR